MRWPPTEDSRALRAAERCRQRGENETTIARSGGERKDEGGGGGGGVQGWKTVGSGREKSKSVVGDY